MKILIVEDNPDKANRISIVMTSLSFVSESDIIVCSDYITAIKAVSEDVFSLVVMDVIIPRRFGDKPSADNGITLLAKFDEIVGSNRPHYIIGLTADRNVFEEKSSMFGKNLWFLLEYSPMNNDWEESVKNKINHINYLRVSADLSSKSYDYDLAVITALPDPEFRAVKNLPLNWMIENRADDVVEYLIANYINANSMTRIVAATASQMGMPPISTLAGKMIAHFRPRYLLILGIAAGYKDICKIGDVMICEQTWDCGSGKIISKDGVKHFLPEPRAISLDGQLRDIFSNYVNRGKFTEKIYGDYNGFRPPGGIKAVIGPIVSGAAVIANEVESAGYRSVHRKITGIDMETYAVFYTAHHCLSPTPYPMSIKCVCDYADEQKDGRFQDFAAYASASYAFELIKAGVFKGA